MSGCSFMVKLKKILIISILLNIVLAVMLGWLYDKTDHKIIQTDLNNSKMIFKKLLELSNEHITRVNCEIYQDNRLVEPEKLKVSHFLSLYLNFLTKTKDIQSFLSCNQREKNECSLSYVNAEELYISSATILFFKINPKTKKIDKTSFQCIDVP